MAAQIHFGWRLLSFIVIWPVKFISRLFIIHVRIDLCIELIKVLLIVVSRNIQRRSWTVIILARDQVIFHPMTQLSERFLVFLGTKNVSNFLVRDFIRACLVAELLPDVSNELIIRFFLDTLIPNWVPLYQRSIILKQPWKSFDWKLIELCLLYCLLYLIIHFFRWECLSGALSHFDSFELVFIKANPIYMPVIVILMSQVTLAELTPVSWNKNLRFLKLWVLVSSKVTLNFGLPELACINKLRLLPLIAPLILDRFLVLGAFLSEIKFFWFYVKLGHFPIKKLILATHRWFFISFRALRLKVIWAFLLRYRAWDFIFELTRGKAPKWIIYIIFALDWAISTHRWSTLTQTQV